jgi:hypothetical protein
MRDKKEKLYISIPISIEEHTVVERYKEVLEYIKKVKSLNKYEIIAPFDIENIEDDLKKDNVHDYAWYMGKDIELLLRCDAILMCKGWHRSNGCNCEHETAKIYNKKIYYQFSYID